MDCYQLWGGNAEFAHACGKSAAAQPAVLRRGSCSDDGRNQLVRTPSSPLYVYARTACSPYTVTWRPVLERKAPATLQADLPCTAGFGLHCEVIQAVGWRPDVPPGSQHLDSTWSRAGPCPEHRAMHM